MPVATLSRRQPLGFQRPSRSFFLNFSGLCSVVLLLLSQVVYSQTFPQNFSQQAVASGLSNPTAMAFAPDGRVFVTEQGGNLRVIKNGSLLPNPFVSLSVDSGGERGLIGIAIDPNFTTNQYIYLYYTVPASGTVTVHNRISRFTANGDMAMSGSEAILFDLDPLSSATNHNGGAMAFGADGKLYVGVGENANAANAQLLTNHLGKVLRINSDGSVPADNPFVNVAGALARIWAYGLRNPYTITFQPGTNRLFVNDVGQNTWEEINEVTGPGLNFGWPLAEGTSSNPAFTNPVFAYSHSATGNAGGCAITGGAFYNPTTATYPASYVGKYFYQDLCNNWINYLDVSGPTATSTAFASGLPASSLAITLGTNGNLFYLSRGAGNNTGVLYEIVYSAPATTPQITGQPMNLTVLQGQSATFSVAASGNDLTYQWQKDGADILGATGPVYTIPTATTTNQGQYRAIVSNPAGSVTSNSASLVVQPIIVDPVPFSIVAPLYNCQTGAITFQTTGDNGTPIEYFAVGITAWSSNPNQTIESGLRADPKPIELYARQAGVMVSYLFNLPAFCGGTPGNQPPVFNGPLTNVTIVQGSSALFTIPPATFTDPEGGVVTYMATGLPDGLMFYGNVIIGTTTQTGSFTVTIQATDTGGLSATGQFILTVTPQSSGGVLQLVAPIYNCASGAITFQTTGGDGSPIEYFAIGITPWTTNPNQAIESGLRADPKPIVLHARQSGIEVTYTFDLPAACLPARQGVLDDRQPLSAIIFPNPVRNEVVVGINGAQGQRIRLQLTDLTGKVVNDQAVDVTSDRFNARLNVVNQASGLYLLRVSSDRQAVTLKVLKQE